MAAATKTCEQLTGADLWCRARGRGADGLNHGQALRRSAGNWVPNGHDESILIHGARVRGRGDTRPAANQVDHNDDDSALDVDCASKPF